MKIKISTIHAVLVYLLVFFTTTYISYNPIKYFLIVAVGLMILPNIKILLLKANRGINCSMAVFCIATLIISYVNRNEYTVRNPFLAAIVFVAMLIEFTMTVEIFSKKNAMADLIKVFYRMTLFVVIINDLLILLTNIHLHYGGDVFLVGTKFTVAYMHFYLIAFFFAHKNIKLHEMTQSALKNKIVLTILFIVTMIMSVKLETATGIVGTVAFILFLWISETNIKVFLNAKSFFVALVASVLFAVFVEIILANGTVSYIITQILGKDITLSHRTIIYAMFPQIMKNRWLCGFGYGSGEVLGEYGIVDAQNGIFDWIQQVGILGTVLLAIWLCTAIKKPKRNISINSSKVSVLTALVYVFVLLATVEITFSLQFFAIVVLLYGAKMQEVQAQERAFK